MKVKLKDKESGQATLEFFLLIAFITVALMISVKLFFPAVKGSFVRIGNIVETYLETGRGFEP